jgi:hypothetical protein
MTNKPTNSELILGIPIDKYEYGKDYVILYSNNQLIGTMPFLNVGNDTFMFDMDQSNLNKLRWDLIYFNNKDIIDNKIKVLFGTEDIEITSSTFRRLYVKNLISGSIKRVDCFYQEKEWVIKSE